MVKLTFFFFAKLESVDMIVDDWQGLKCQMSDKYRPPKIHIGFRISGIFTQIRSVISDTEYIRYNILKSYFIHIS